MMAKLMLSMVKMPAIGLLAAANRRSTFRSFRSSSSISLSSFASAVHGIDSSRDGRAEEETVSHLYSPA